MHSRKSIRQKSDEPKRIFLASFDNPPANAARGTRRSPYYAANPNLGDHENLALLRLLLCDSRRWPAACTLHFLPGRYAFRAGMPAGKENA